MVTVATQTDGCVEIGFRELCGSLSPAASPVDTYDCREKDDEIEMSCVPDEKHCVMSSQTDLALSDFESRRFEWDDEDDGEDDIEILKLHGLLEECSKGDGYGNDKNLEEHIYEVPLDNFDNSDILQSSMLYETLRCLNEPWRGERILAERQYCFHPSEKMVLDRVSKGSCATTRPLNGYCGMTILMSKMSRLQLDNNVLQSPCFSDSVNQRRLQFSFRSRIVPRMGTKVECLKNFSEHQMFQLPVPVENSDQSQISSKVSDRAADDMKIDQNAVDLFSVPDSQPRYMLDMYHSDSEHSYASIREITSHHKDWSSDGDADNLTQTLNNDVRQSIDFIDTELLSPESRSRVESVRQSYDQCAGIMYTNQANLQHTIMVQQCLFQQQLASRQRKDVLGDKTTEIDSDILLPGEHLEPANDSGGMQDRAVTAEGKCRHEQTSQLEWIAKRRPDGTRYVTRRPVKSRLLKERGKQLAAQLNSLPTTDDDTASEAKAGRYWSREERRRHLEQIRCQKRKKQSRLNVLQTSAVEEELSKHDVASLQQQQHKISKYQNRRVLENCTTSRDLLLHRSVDSRPKGKVCSPLLSVTTI